MRAWGRGVTRRRAGAALVLAGSLGAVVAVPGVVNAAGEAQGGTTSVGTSVLGVAVTGDGTAIAVGRSSAATMLVQPVSPDGTARAAFAAGNGIARAAIVRPDGKVLVAGQDRANGVPNAIVRRFNPDGSLDAGFGSGGTAQVPGSTANAIAFGPCGSLFVAGSIPGDDGFPRVTVTKLSADGAADGSFGSGGTATPGLGRNARALGVAVQPDGKPVISGDQAPGLQLTGAYVARLTAGGDLDGGYASGGVYTYAQPDAGAYVSLRGVAIDPEGRAVAAGVDRRAGGGFAIFVRLTSSGALDPSFDGDGAQAGPSTVRYSGGDPVGPSSVAIAGGGEIVAAGAFQDSGLRSQALWTLSGGGQFDGGSPILRAPDGDGAQGNAVAVGPDGTILVGGETQNFFGPDSGLVARNAGFGVPPASPFAPCDGGGSTGGGASTGGGGSTPAAVATETTATPPVTTATDPTLVVPVVRLTKARFSPSVITFTRSSTLSFALTRPSTVTIRFDRRVIGRKVGRFCSAKVKRGVGCLLYVPAGTRTIAAREVNAVRLSRVFAGRPLPIGIYRVTIAAAGGNSVQLTVAVRKR